MVSKVRPPLASTATTTAADRPAAPVSRFGALSQPKYRRFWLGSLAAVSGIQFLQVAQGWLIVKELGGTGLDLGFLGAAIAIPSIVVNLFGGVLADRLDRKRILISTYAAAGALLAVLAVLDATNAVRIWHVLVISVGIGLTSGLGAPASNAFFPQLITREHMASAVTLNSIVWQGTRVFAPGIGGILIAASGTEVVFFVAAGGFVAMTLILMTLTVPPERPRPRRAPMRELAEGFQFIKGAPLFRVLIPLTYANMFLGMQYIPLMPLFADRFGADSRQFGSMLSILGVGAVTGTVLANRLQGGRRLGSSMLGATLVFTMLLAAFAFAPSYAVSLPLLFLAAMFNSVFMINSMTALQLQVPNDLRGRVMGIHTITYSLIPLGGLLGGGVATLTDERWAVAGSALALTLVLVFVAVTQRHIRELDGSRLRDQRPA